MSPNIWSEPWSIQCRYAEQETSMSANRYMLHDVTRDQSMRWINVIKIGFDLWVYFCKRGWVMWFCIVSENNLLKGQAIHTLMNWYDFFFSSFLAHLKKNVFVDFEMCVQVKIRFFFFTFKKKNEAIGNWQKSTSKLVVKFWSKLASNEQIKLNHWIWEKILLLLII